METATREVYWNVHAFVLPMYAIAVLAVAACLYGFYARLRRVLIGVPDVSIDRWPERLRAVWLWESRFCRRRLAGPMHFVMLWGMVLLFFGTVVVFLHEDLGLHVMAGGFYLVFQSLILDVAGLLSTLGLVAALLQRYVLRLPRLQKGTTADGLLLSLLLVLLVTGFVLEGLRILSTADPWAAWSPVGQALGILLAPALGSLEGQALAHRATWLLHVGVAFAIIGLLPYTKLGHLVLSPVNVFLRPLEGCGALRTIDFEKQGTVGVARIADFTRKQLIDLEACTACGRCEERCPAFAMQKPLSPRQLIQDLRAELRAHSAQKPPDDEPIVPRAVAEETIWSCTTCLACQTECPVYVEPVPKILDLRRYQVMEAGAFPAKLQEISTCLDKRGHPFPGTAVSRAAWTAGLEGLDQHRGADGASLLYWVGCAASLNERTTKVAAAFYQILHQTGVSFRVLQAKEPCCGDPARRIGNEYQFTAIARKNLNLFRTQGITRIVTPCPHCFSAFKNDYLQLGGQLEVIHHSQMLADLARSGRIALDGAAGKTVTYHDPCYLGRYNGVYDPVRSLLSGLELREMSRSASNSLCCGGGGGRFWIDEQPQHRVSYLRAQQALETGARTLVTACPFCLLMLDEACTSKTKGQVEAVDVSEVALRALRPANGTRAAL